MKRSANIYGCVSHGEIVSTSSTKFIETVTSFLVPNANIRGGAPAIDRISVVKCLRYFMHAGQQRPESHG